jgi:hypothetical protein
MPLVCFAADHSADESADESAAKSADESAALAADLDADSSCCSVASISRQQFTISVTCGAASGDQVVMSGGQRSITDDQGYLT